jgi:predicted Zn-ribbon and HTH transcriptional regulator
MGQATVSLGFHQISRHDGIFKEHVHDSYKAKGKLPEPAACSQCGAVFHHGHWQWLPAPEYAHMTTCPACHRIRDEFPAGYVTLNGEFFKTHHEEIMRLVRNHEKHQRAEHPLKRIMAIEEKNGTTLITTTDIHLARGIGELVHQAYSGKLAFQYNPEQYLLRVNWSR